MISQVDNRAEQLRHVVALQCGVSGLFARVAGFMEAVAAPRRSLVAPLIHAAGLLRVQIALLPHVAVALAGYAALQESLAVPLGPVAGALLRVAALQRVRAALQRLIAAPIQQLTQAFGLLKQTATGRNVTEHYHINAARLCPATASSANVQTRALCKPALGENSPTRPGNVSTMRRSSAAMTRKQTATLWRKNTYRYKTADRIY